MKATRVAHGCVYFDDQTTWPIPDVSAPNWTSQANAYCHLFTLPVRVRNQRIAAIKRAMRDAAQPDGTEKGKTR